MKKLFINFKFYNFFWLKYGSHAKQNPLCPSTPTKSLIHARIFVDDSRQGRACVDFLFISRRAEIPFKSAHVKKKDKCLSRTTFLSPFSFSFRNQKRSWRPSSFICFSFHHGFLEVTFWIHAYFYLYFISSWLCIIRLCLWNLQSLFIFK